MEKYLRSIYFNELGVAKAYIKGIREHMDGTPIIKMELPDGMLEDESDVTIWSMTKQIQNYRLWISVEIMTSNTSPNPTKLRWSIIDDNGTAHIVDFLELGDEKNRNPYDILNECRIGIGYSSTIDSGKQYVTVAIMYRNYFTSRVIDDIDKRMKESHAIFKDAADTKVILVDRNLMKETCTLDSVKEQIFNGIKVSNFGELELSNLMSTIDDFKNNIDVIRS